MTRRLILVACGNRKRRQPARAADLYVGRYAAVPIRWALSVDPDATRILSAKHGLLHPDDVIAPYNIKMSDPDAIGWRTVRDQADAAGLLDADPVHVLPMGDAYRTMIARIWPHAVRLFVGGTDRRTWTVRIEAAYGRDVRWQPPDRQARP